VSLKARLTPSQTVGPFFHPTLLRVDARITDLTPANHTGPAITIRGRVVDGKSDPVPDAAIELWQADESGHYFTPAPGDGRPSPDQFIGYGRAGTDDEGWFEFRTLKPGGTRFDEQRLQAPHICVTIYARGLLNHLVTRIYFADEPSNTEDPILQLVDPDRRNTLIAAANHSDGDSPVYRFDIVLQGDRETLFFNI
jgi:protocatechuate 3,4-dioxygenase, alpha subunit